MILACLDSKWYWRLGHVAEASKLGSGQTGVLSWVWLNIVLCRNCTVSCGKNHIMLLKDLDGNWWQSEKWQKSHFTQWFEMFHPHLIEGFVMVFMTYHIRDKNSLWPNCLELEINQRKAINQSNSFQVSSVCSTLYWTLWEMIAHTAKLFGEYEVNVEQYYY